MTDDTQKLIRRRRIAGRISGVLLAICFLCILDGLTASWRTPFNTLDAVGGQSFPINGSLPEGARDTSDVRVEGSSQNTWSLTALKVYKGFWFGGLMWKGTLSVAPDAPPGAYPIVVRGPGKKPPSPLSRFTLRIHPDKLALRRTAASYAMRLLGLHPFTVAGLLFLAVLFTGCAGFLLSKKIAALHRREGKADIFLVEKKPEGVLVSFSLGKDFNVEPGASVAIQNEDGETLCRAVVVEVRPFDSKALVSTDAQGVKPGLIAKLIA